MGWRCARRRSRSGDPPARGLEISPWREWPSAFERDRDVALQLRVQPDDWLESGVAELRPHGPRPLIADAEAQTPVERRE